MLPEFNTKQLDRISEQSANVSLVFFGSLVVPMLFDNVVKLNIGIFGLFLSAGFFIISIIILNNNDKR